MYMTTAPCLFMGAVLLFVTQRTAIYGLFGIKYRLSDFHAPKLVNQGIFRPIALQQGRVVSSCVGCLSAGNRFRQSGQSFDAV